MQPRAVSYEEQVTLIREQLSELSQQQEDWSKAAQVRRGPAPQGTWCPLQVGVTRFRSSQLGGKPALPARGLDPDWLAVRAALWVLQALAGIELDSGMRVLGAEYKLAKNIQIAMLYLEVRCACCGVGF